MKYKAENLPAGLSLDEQTGMITGILQRWCAGCGQIVDGFKGRRCPDCSFKNSTRNLTIAKWVLFLVAIALIVVGAML